MKLRSKSKKHSTCQTNSYSWKIKWCLFSLNFSVQPPFYLLLLFDFIYEGSVISVINKLNADTKYALLEDRRVTLKWKIHRTFGWSEWHHHYRAGDRAIEKSLFRICHLTMISLLRFAALLVRRFSFTIASEFEMDHTKHRSALSSTTITTNSGNINNNNYCYGIRIHAIS